MADIIAETDWAYLAGMLDGEGYIGLIHHHRQIGYHVSARGYDLETQLTIANMNLANLEKSKICFQWGR